MKVCVFILIIGLVLCNQLNGQNNLRQEYQFAPWSLDCTNRCQSAGGVVCGYETQVCCKSGRCQKGWKSEQCGIWDRIHVLNCVPGPSSK
ncbi:unnamed protein product [Paramecium primaurelia]|uniref:Uncharacterized protein n=2 Tax=Paramecium TaxID=5884 RepID=A0A8S1UFM3_9CILI|nr:unnamed protein product [Paramecium primaurelia]CAD8162937.1 unnamed protein product [Paramecium pentaurelia]